MRPKEYMLVRQPFFFPCHLAFTGNSVKENAGGRFGEIFLGKCTRGSAWEERGLFYTRISSHISVIRQRYGPLIDRLSLMPSEARGLIPFAHLL